MKKTLLTTALLGVILSTPLVFADSKRGNDDVMIPSAPSVSFFGHTEEKEEGFNDRSFRNVSTTTLLVRLQKKGDLLISERIKTLESNKSVIVSNTSLTAEQKNVILGQIATTTIGLSTLKNAIASSTDASSTKVLIGSIFTQLRVYGIVIPQVRLEKRIYDLQNHSTTLSNTFLKVQTKIDEAKASGKDVTVWQKSLDDAKVLVANDMNILATALPKVTSLTPNDYGTTSKALIASVNTDLKKVLKDFASIKKNLHRPAFMGNSSRKVVGNGLGSTSPLFGTTWIWVSAVDGTTTVAVPSGDKFQISFGEDNRVSNTTDCNMLNGSYKVEGGKITFGPMMMTMMFCEGSQEGVYSRLLSKVTGYSVSGAQLTFTTDTGTMIFKKK